MPSQPSQNELWYAARMTRVVYRPPRLLETFGETSVFYSVLSEIFVSDESKIRLRNGVIRAARPKVITPHFLLNQALENFGPDARKYFADLLQRKDGTRILQYGLTLQKEEHSEEIIGGEILETADQIAREAQDNLTEVRGVIIGMDQFWEVSLLGFANDLIKRSAPYNAREMSRHGLFNLDQGIPRAIHQEIEADFAAANTRAKADDLGKKLRDYGLFDDYEDRFFELYKAVR
ncbi:MAG TPA: hypothetical protein PLE92_03975 [Lentisphaeria bacterium]|nr:MAG: hypothetical protein BWX73_00476 [Lentisphaerae bacterium ADurb.Bin082]HPY90427.1 hypothetical protein [Lentisphaeria bacterium]HQC52265.1 hypothetical protein [Lentisphaeria bacterium]HQL86553.1 hypothetical protein [Lentisphaeria bacterium]